MELDDEKEFFVYDQTYGYLDAQFITTNIEIIGSNHAILTIVVDDDEEHTNEREIQFHTLFTKISKNGTELEMEHAATTTIFLNADGGGSLEFIGAVFKENHRGEAELWIENCHNYLS